MEAPVQLHMLHMPKSGPERSYLLTLRKSVSNKRKITLESRTKTSSTFPLAALKGHANVKKQKIFDHNYYDEICLIAA